MDCGSFVCSIAKVEQQTQVLLIFPPRAAKKDAESAEDAKDAEAAEGAKDAEGAKGAEGAEGAADAPGWDLGLGWREDVRRERERRKDFKQNEMQLAAELRKYREMHHARVQACIGMWGSESRSVMLGSSFPFPSVSSAAVSSAAAVVGPDALAAGGDTSMDPSAGAEGVRSAALESAAASVFACNALASRSGRSSIAVPSYLTAGAAPTLPPLDDGCTSIDPCAVPPDCSLAPAAAATPGTAALSESTATGLPGRLRQSILPPATQGQ